MRWLLWLYDLGGLNPDTLRGLVSSHTRTEQLKLSLVGVANLVSALVVAAGVFAVLVLAFDSVVFSALAALAMALFVINLLRLVVAGSGHARWHAEVPEDWRPSMWTIGLLLLFAVPFSQAALLAAHTVDEATVEATREAMVALRTEVVYAALDTRKLSLTSQETTLTESLDAIVAAGEGLGLEAERLRGQASMVQQRLADLEAERERARTEDLPAYAAHIAEASLLVKRVSLAWQEPQVALPVSVVLALLILGGPLVWLVITREGQSTAIEWPARSSGLAWSYQVEQHRLDRARILRDHALVQAEIDRLLAPYAASRPAATSGPHFEDPPFNTIPRSIATVPRRRGRLERLLEQLPREE